MEKVYVFLLDMSCNWKPLSTLFFIELIPPSEQPYNFAFSLGAHTHCCNDLSVSALPKLPCDLQGSYCTHPGHPTLGVPSTGAANNHRTIERIPLPFNVHFSRLANPLVYSWKHFPTSHILLNLGSVWGEYSAKLMFVKSGGEPLTITSSQESTKTPPKSMKHQSPPNWEGLICLPFLGKWWSGKLVL